MSAFPDGSADFRGGGTLTLQAGGTLLPPSSQAFTVAWWMKQDTARQAGVYYWVWTEEHVNTGLAGAGDRAVAIWDNGVGVYRTIMHAADGTSSSTGSFGDPSSGWIFVVAVYDPTTFPPNPTMRGWTNDIGPGSNTSATALMQPAVAGTFWGIATGPTTGGVNNWNLGRIDAMSVWSGALQQADVDRLWNNGQGVNLPGNINGGLAAISAPLIAWWPFDEPSGSSVWNDYSGNRHHLLASGTINHGGPRNT